MLIVTKILLAKAADVTTPPEMACWMQELANDMYTVHNLMKSALHSQSRRATDADRRKTLEILEKYDMLSGSDKDTLRALRGIEE